MGIYPGDVVSLPQGGGYGIVRSVNRGGIATVQTANYIAGIPKDKLTATGVCLTKLPHTSVGWARAVREYAHG